MGIPESMNLSHKGKRKVDVGWKWEEETGCERGCGEEKSRWDQM